MRFTCTHYHSWVYIFRSVALRSFLKRSAFPTTGEGGNAFRCATLKELDSAETLRVAGGMIE